MKRLIVFTGMVFLLVETPVFAQAPDTRETLHFGFKAGLNNSNVWDEEGQDFQADPKYGFAGGAFLSIPLGRYFGIQPEVLYSQKGYQASGTAFGTPYSYVRTTNYIDVPLMLQFKPSRFITIVGGPNYSFLTSAIDERRYGSYSTAQEETFNNDNLRKNTLGAIVGADFTVDNLVIAPRIGWDFQTNNGDGTSSSPRYRNQWIQLTVGYRF